MWPHFLSEGRVWPRLDDIPTPAEVLVRHGFVGNDGAWKIVSYAVSNPINTIVCAGFVRINQSTSAFWWAAFA